jgi:hypothetical protein
MNHLYKYSGYICGSVFLGIRLGLLGEAKVEGNDQPSFVIKGIYYDTMVFRHTIQITDKKSTKYWTHGYTTISTVLPYKGEYTPPVPYPKD